MEEAIGFDWLMKGQCGGRGVVCSGTHRWRWLEALGSCDITVRMKYARGCIKCSAINITGRGTGPISDF